MYPSFAFSGQDKNRFYFRKYYSYSVYDYPDYDRVHHVLKLKVYVYPWHSPVYYARLRTVYLKHGAVVERKETAWFPVRIKCMVIDARDIREIETRCGIKMKRGG